MWNQRIANMAFVLSLLPFCLTSFAYGQTPIFGPEVYTRGTGKPQKIVKSFSVQNPTGGFTIFENS